MVPRIQIWCAQDWRARRIDKELDLDRVTLCFRNSGRETAFLRARHDQLASNMFLLFALDFLWITTSLLLLSPKWSTSGGVFVEAEESKMVALVRNILIVVSGGICILLMVVAKYQKLRSSLGLLGFEIVALSGILVIVSLIAMAHPWYAARMCGVESSLVVPGQISMDANLLLIMDAFITAVHFALPMRWVVLWVVEIFVVFCYVAVVFALGSPESKDVVTLNITMISILCLTAGVGRRSIERYERAAFARVAAEKSKRYQVEHRLEQVLNDNSKEGGNRNKGPAARRPDHDEQASTGMSAYTEEIFGSLEGASPETMEKHVDEIAKLGLQEHWLIPAAELEPECADALGHGGFGVVVAGRYHGARVALKVALYSKGLASVANEIRMLRRLRHPNIVPFYGASILPSTHELVLVLECVRGMQLAAFVKVPPSAPDTADRLKLLDDMCWALRYLHAQSPNVVHGDFKPSNIQVDLSAGLSAKLLDFGLSRLSTPRTAGTGGTVKWMAPEVINNWNSPRSPRRFGQWLTPGADVFSFGRLLFFVMTGQHPLRDVSIEDIVTAAKKGQPHAMTWPRQAPLAEECAETCEACTTFDVTNRPSMVEVQEKLLLLRHSPGERRARVSLDHVLSELRGQVMDEQGYYPSTSSIAETPVDWGPASGPSGFDDQSFSVPAMATSGEFSTQWAAPPIQNLVAL